MRLKTMVLMGSAALLTSGAVRSSPGGPRVAWNDNREPAGALARGVLTLSLVAQAGEWRPFGADGPGASVLTFGEAGKGLQDPGPLIRVPLGTSIHVTVKNLTGVRLVVHGFSARRVAVMDTLDIPPGEAREARFTPEDAGTFYYWGSVDGIAVNDRILRDAHLNGALIVDPAGAAARAPDRVFVVERWVPDTQPNGNPDFDHELMTLNGRPWPLTERLAFDVGDSVRWRFINVSGDIHPFHLHGFFYRVDGRGDFVRDTVYWPGERRMVVTETMMPGTTMDLAWSPDRPGGWIFHCHFSPHVWPNTGLPPDTEPGKARVAHLLNGYPEMPGMNAEHRGMGGLVLGLYVRPPAGWRPYAGARRTVRLLVQSDSGPGDSLRRFAYVLQEGDRTSAPDAPGSPGPALILHRGEPTRIWVVNHTPEMTQVHWHGLEIESTYDGVGGTSGVGPARAHPIAPGDSFEVLVTPPRAGTFIYHTHFNDLRQLSHGLYGPLIVLDTGTRWNPDSDQVFIVGADAVYDSRLYRIPAGPAPSLRAGVAYRFRLINITLFDAQLTFTLVRNGAPVRWKPLAKDGYTLPPWQAGVTDARQIVSVGETYDFSVQAADTGAMTLEVRQPDGTLVGSQLIRVGKSGP